MPSLLRLAATPLVAMLATAATAAPLATTPDTLLARTQLLRDAADRPFDLPSGRLGNLRHAQIVAPGCTVRVISGPENRLIQGNAAVQVLGDTRPPGTSPGGKPTPRDLVFKASGNGGAGLCFTLQVATAHDFLVGGDRLALLFDRTALPVVRLYVNPSAGVKLWFSDVRIGLLSVTSNANVLAGGTGQVSWLQLDSSQRSTALLFHDLQARQIGVTTTTGGARYAIRIGTDTRASYAQPARAPGNIALEYPIWIDGPVSALEMPLGRVNPMPITAAIRQEANAVRDEVLRRAGPLPPPPAGPVADPLQAGGGDREPLSAGQQVANVLQPFLPADTSLDRVQLWKNGAALEGGAPNEASVREVVQALLRSGEVRNAQIGWIRPDQTRVAWRVRVDFMCAAPGEPSRCLPGTGSAYTQQQVEDALRPLLGAASRTAHISLTADGEVVLDVPANDDRAAEALNALSGRVPWLEGSRPGFRGQRYYMHLRLVCQVPPRAHGICVASKPDR